MYIPTTPFVTWTICKGTSKSTDKVEALTPDDLKRIIADVFNTEWSQVEKRGRKPKMVQARNIFYRLMKDKFKSSSVKTAKHFEQHHTTVLYGLMSVKRNMDSKDPYWNDFRKKFQEIKSLIH